MMILRENRKPKSLQSNKVILMEGCNELWCHDTRRPLNDMPFCKSTQTMVDNENAAVTVIFIVIVIVTVISATTTNDNNTSTEGVNGSCTECGPSIVDHSKLTLLNSAHNV